MRAHKYLLAAVSNTFKSWFFGQEEIQALDYCDNKSFHLCDQKCPDAVKKFKMQCKMLKGAVPGQICDKKGEVEYAKQTGVEDINIVCSSVSAFQVPFLC